MKIILIISIFFLGSCSTVRESAGVNRKSIDEFSVVENPPLIIPPDFDLLSNGQLIGKKIIDTESELGQEILFGLDDNDVLLQKKTGTINQILLNSQALETSPSIREEIDKEFAMEINTKGIFQTNFEDEIEVLDAIKESERIRNKKFDGESIAEGEIPTKKQIIKKKKKKRFFLF